MPFTRKIPINIILLLSLTLTVSGHGAIVDKVIVVVNDEVITQREFDRLFDPIKTSFMSAFKGEELTAKLEEAKKQLTEQIINNKLAISIARKNKIKIDEAKLNERIDKIKSFYGNEELFLKALSEKGTNLTEFRKEIEEQMMSQEIIEKDVASNIIITPADISDVYEKNKSQLNAPARLKVKSIMLKKDESLRPDEARKKLNTIKDKHKKGSDFGKLAGEFSQGPYASKDGDMGFVIKGQLLEQIDDVIFEYKPGEVTEIIETPIGYHIFLIDSREEARTLTLDEVSDFIRGEIFKRRFNENLSKWLTDKRKNAYISYK